MYATVVVLLPSVYEGSEVHVSHAGVEKVFDFSAQSKFATALLAWFTDVTHDVKPVTSGYRLALSYNLIHTAPHATLPSVPAPDRSSAELRRVLENWKKGLTQMRAVFRSLIS